MSIIVRQPFPFLTTPRCQCSASLTGITLVNPCLLFNASGSPMQCIVNRGCPKIYLYRIHNEKWQLYAGRQPIATLLCLSLGAVVSKKYGTSTDTSGVGKINKITRNNFAWYDASMRTSHTTTNKTFKRQIHHRIVESLFWEPTIDNIDNSLHILEEQGWMTMHFLVALN